eukprot:10983633-Alexandrium_andersonii.AAC.1
MTKTTASKYKISGFKRLDERGRDFATMASIVAFVSDSVLTELMEDDRVARQVLLLEETLRDEYQWLLNIDGPVWSLLATACSLAPLQLRADCCSAGLASVAFITQRLFRAAKAYPWRLAQGDIQEQLLALKSQPAPEEPTTLKIWKLLQA